MDSDSLPLPEKRKPAKTIVQPEVLLSSLLQSAHQLIPFDIGVLALWDTEGQVLVPFYEDRQQKGAQAYKTPPFLRLGEGIVGHVAITRQAIYVPDVLKDPRYIATHAKTRSELAVPIMLDGEFLGVFNVESETPAAYNETHLAILQGLAGQAALVIETTRLYNSLRDNYHELQDAHATMVLRNEISRLAASDSRWEQRLPAMAEYLAQYADTESCVMTLQDETHYEKAICGWWCSPGITFQISLERLGEALTGILAQTIKPIVLNSIVHSASLPVPELHEAGAEAVLALPLVARRRVIGSVVFLRARENQAFLAQDINRLQASLDQIALGIDNQQLLQTTQAHLSETQALLRLAEILAGNTNLDDMMRQVLELTRHMLNVKAGTVLIYDRYESMLMPLWTGFGLPDSFYLMRFPVNEPRSRFAIAFNMSHPQYVNDISGLSGPEHDLATEAGLSNLLVVPLRVQDHALGVFVVANRAQGFSEYESQFLTAMGSHIAAALRNLEYLEQLRLFKGLSQVVQRVSAELASEQVLVAACQSVVEAIEGIDHAGIVLNDQAPISGIVVAEYPLKGGIRERLRLEGYGLHKRISETLAPVVVSDVSSAEDLLVPNFDLLYHNLGIKSLMVVPLIVQNEFIGSIGIDAIEEIHQFTAAEIDVMSAIAAQLAISIRNAELFEQLATRSRELAEANRLKNEFLTKMSHELRTPMNSILGFSDALLSGLYGELNDRQRNRMERIQRNGRNLLSLIDDLLDLSKIEAGRMELDLRAVNAKEEVQTCLLAVESQVQSKNLRLHFLSPENLPAVSADPLRLRQVINNLLSNAIKFTREGGVTVRIAAQTPEQTAGQNSHEVWISISDTGIGIKPEHFEIIFDEFRQADGSTTREFGGTGLGLAISKRLIEMMQGRIWLESEYGKGSTFTFALPVAQVVESSPAEGN